MKPATPQHIRTIGFVSAPNWFDPAPAEFPKTVTELVKTQQAPLLLSNFDYLLENIAKTLPDITNNAMCLRNMGCDVIAQVGSPFTWAHTPTEKQARERCEAVQKAAQRPVLMTGLSIVNALRAGNIKSIAVNCTYYDAEWSKEFVAFLEDCGFTIVHNSTLAEQRLGSIESITDYGWAMTDDLTKKSIKTVAKIAPEAEAIVVTGAGARTFNILTECEQDTGRPVIAADTALYWDIARTVGLSLTSSMGHLATL